MKEWLVLVTENVIVLIDGVALLIVLIGTVEALTHSVRLLSSAPTGRTRRDIWLRYARWLVAGLTFQLAADIVETSITTDWEALGRLAAIAVIRTFLNYFLERDVDEIGERQRAAAEPTR